MSTIAIRLDPEVRHKLEQLARMTGRTRSSLVAEAVRRFVDAEIAEASAGGEKGGTEQADNAVGMPERWNIIV
ncbi:MAG: ribbon-helix-helix domain-containing protein [Desulfovibrio sp.]|jgi:predicted transcriptional regulator|nr:ribbon-helix-helix domain-containing protein [Desulfovibrio sp.]